MTGITLISICKVANTKSVKDRFNKFKGEATGDLIYCRRKKQAQKNLAWRGLIVGTDERT